MKRFLNYIILLFLLNSTANALPTPCNIAGEVLEAARSATDDAFGWLTKVEINTQASSNSTFFDPRIALRFKYSGLANDMINFFARLFGLKQLDEEVIIDFKGTGECQFRGLSRYCARITPPIKDKYGDHFATTIGGKTLQLPKICIFEDPLDLADFDPKFQPFHEWTDLEEFSKVANAGATLATAGVITVNPGLVISGAVIAAAGTLGRYTNVCVLRTVGCTSIPLSPSPPSYTKTFSKPILSTPLLYPVCEASQLPTAENFCVQTSINSTYTKPLAFVITDDVSFTYDKCSRNDDTKPCVIFRNFQDASGEPEGVTANPKNYIPICSSSSTSPCFEPKNDARISTNQDGNFVFYNKINRGDKTFMVPYAINASSPSLIVDHTYLHYPIQERDTNFKPEKFDRMLACGTGETPDKHGCVLFNLKGQYVKQAKDCKHLGSKASSEPCLTLPYFIESSYPTPSFEIEYVKSNTTNSYTPFSVTDLKYDVQLGTPYFTRYTSFSGGATNNSLSLTLPNGKSTVNYNLRFNSTISPADNNMCISWNAEGIDNAPLGCVPRPPMPQLTAELCNGKNGCGIATNNVPLIKAKLCLNNNCHEISGMVPEGIDIYNNSFIPSNFDKQYILFGTKLKATVYSSYDNREVNDAGDLQANLQLQNSSRQVELYKINDPFNFNNISGQYTDRDFKHHKTLQLKIGLEYKRFAYQSGADLVCVEPADGEFDFLKSNFLVTNYIIYIHGYPTPKPGIRPQDIIYKAEDDISATNIDIINHPAAKACTFNENPKILDPRKCSIVKPHPLQLPIDQKDSLCFTIPNRDQPGN
ncbi:hypothetical protein [Rickettsiales endosymbiont of Stachyamoeba lipophora]|uniref:hypothetical protein n=1 Tax=Rickettsiales endosymbiont of Stachyamoeba lipophora TaxID=2486578 RepID=UPI000F646839|nr:hypothetical protein [Rickettsiales endosymbiont of Stachyamoeba lipophora]AZL16142.1 hypothetical protein EF513_06310 [Rickettsiales endosymbiont of Stachyamoeba lipophora]